MQYKYIIFDMDGTIIDPIEGIVNALNILCEKHKLHKLPFRELGIIGPPMKKTLMRLYGFDDAVSAEYAKKFRDIYINQTILQSVLYEGIKELFGSLYQNGIKIGIATYKRTDCAEMVIKHFGLQEFVSVVSGDTPNSNLEKADIIRICMDKMGVEDKTEVLMVGDTAEDAKGAEKAEVDFCGATYGYGYTEKKMDGMYIEEPLQLMEILKDTNGTVYCL